MSLAYCRDCVDNLWPLTHAWRKSLLLSQAEVGTKGLGVDLAQEFYGRPHKY